jgi:hypothetical protein
MEGEMEASISKTAAVTTIIPKIALPALSEGLNNIHVHKVKDGDQTEYFAILTKEGNISNKLDNSSDVTTIHGVVQGESYSPGVLNKELPKYLIV